MNDFTREFDIANGRRTDGQKKNNNLVEFFDHLVEDEVATAKAGRPIAKSITMVRIMMIGDKNSVVERKVTPQDKVQYARQWSAFEKQQEVSVDGTPLESWPMLSRTTVRELKHFQIYTLEQLASLNDGQIMQIGILGLRTIVRSAKATLEMAKTGAVPAALVHESETLKAENAQLRQALAAANLRYETEIKAAGRNAAFENVTLAVTPTVEVSTEIAIPDDFSKMGGREVMALAKQVTGLVARNRAEAEEALREAKSAGA